MLSQEGLKGCSAVKFLWQAALQLHVGTTVTGLSEKNCWERNRHVSTFHTWTVWVAGTLMQFPAKNLLTLLYQFLVAAELPSSVGWEGLESNTSSLSWVVKFKRATAQLTPACSAIANIILKSSQSWDCNKTTGEISFQWHKGALCSSQDTHNKMHFSKHRSRCYVMPLCILIYMKKLHIWVSHT